MQFNLLRPFFTFIPQYRNTEEEKDCMHISNQDANIFTLFFFFLYVAPVSVQLCLLLMCSSRRLGQVWSFIKGYLVARRESKLLLQFLPGGCTTGVS